MPKPFVPKATKAQYHDLYVVQGLGMTLIAKRLSTSSSKVLKDLQHFEIPRRQRRMSKHSSTDYRPLEGKAFYTKKYVKEGLGTHAIAKELGCGHSKVKKDLLHFGIRLRAQTPHEGLRRDYFSQIDSHTKAYLLGFIMADGSVSDKTWQLRIRIAVQDRDFLEKVRAELRGPPLRKIAPKNPQRQQIQLNLCLSSKQLVQDLGRLGVLPAKDKVLPRVVPPPARFLVSYVRGLVDGDGALQISRTGVPRMSFVNRNEHLLRIVSDFWEEIVGERPSRYVHRQKYPGVYLRAAATRVAAKVMYLAAPEWLALPRKARTARKICGLPHEP